MDNPTNPQHKNPEAARLFERIWNSLVRVAPDKPDETKPLLSTSQNGETLGEASAVPQPKEETTYYLAYGSNLCAQTFLGRRGIRPLSAKNVLVPGFALVFDLPGLPYLEPCFANLNRRGDDIHSQEAQGVDTYMADLSTHVARNEADGDEGRKWEKALIGVVYEVTMSDFAKIIMTEGGGEGYQDILVDCYVLPPTPAESSVDASSSSPSSSSETYVTATTTLRAHTLLAPSSKTRPDLPLQPSPRYLNLLVTGANEHSLPPIYIKYLTQLHPYRRTTYRQTVGAFVLAFTWAMPLLLTFKLGEIFVDRKTGRVDKWVARLREGVAFAMWAWYGGFAKWVFGDGVKTIGEKGVGSGRVDGLGKMEDGVASQHAIPDGGIHGLTTDQADVMEALGDAEEDVVRQVLHMGRK